MHRWNSTGEVVSTTLAELFVGHEAVEAEIDDDRDKELGRGKCVRF